MDSDVIDLRSILHLLRRRIWLILIVTVLVLGAAGLSLLALKPVYSATALVLVDPSKKNLLDPNDASGPGNDSARVDSEVELVNSPTTMLAVAKELDLANDPEFGVRLGLRDMLLAFFRIAEPTLPTGDEALSTVMGNLSSAVSVGRRDITYLINVSARSSRPEMAAKIANSLARNYITEQLNNKVASTLASRDIIQARIADASGTVSQSENAFDQFVDQNLDRISEATGRQDFKATRAEIDQLTRNRLTSAQTADIAGESLARRDWASVASSLKDEAVASLEKQRQDMLNRLNTAAQGSQDAIDLKAGLAQIESNLQVTAATAVTALRSQVTESQSQITDLRAQLRTSILNSDLPSDVLTNIYELQQTAEIARSQYQTLLTRQKDLDTQAYLQVADSRLVSEATPPGSPSFPNPRLILTVAAVVGAALGIGLAFLIENFVGGFSSEAQAESILKVPVASSVPRQKPLKRNRVDSLTVADALIVAPLSIYSESIRRVRMAVTQGAERRRAALPGESRTGMVVVVSSAAPNEGKTTVALSLTRAYSLAGLSTLLIDCDLRKPSVHRQLGMDASEGLLEYLSGQHDVAELKTIMTVDDGSGAQVVLGSRRSDVATDQLIAGKTFAQLVAAARKNFDVVVLDTPPVGPVVDGLYLAGMADAIVFVVKWSDTPQQEVKSAVASLVGAKPVDVPLVVVLNQQIGNPAAYRSKYASYYAEA